MQFMWSRFRRLAWARLGVSVALAVLLAALASYALHALSDNPRTLTAISARSEYASFSVFNPDLAIIYAKGLRIVTSSEANVENQCGSGVILPGVGSRVSYQRIEKNLLLITIEGKGELRDPRGKGLFFDGEIILQTDVTCDGAMLTNRLPIWGPGKIGSPFAMRSDGPSPTLLSGTLDVFGRTISVPVLNNSGSIYAAIDDMAIPPGSVVESERHRTRGGSLAVPDSESAMFGFIEVSEEPGFAISVSTESPELSITPPGARSNSSRIDLSLFVQVLNDPVFLQIQLFFVLLFLLWPIFIDAVGLAYSRNDESGSECLQGEASILPAVSHPQEKRV